MKLHCIKCEKAFMSNEANFEYGTSVNDEGENITKALTLKLDCPHCQYKNVAQFISSHEKPVKKAIKKAVLKKVPVPPQKPSKKKKKKK